MFVKTKKKLIEKKKKTVTSMVNAKARESTMDEDWFYRKFSSFRKIVRLVAWVYRFLNNARKKNVTGELSFSELEDAEIKVLKFIQEQSFNGVEDSKIKNLCPFVDDKGVIRLKTKIVQRDDTFSFRCPVLLPSSHPVVTRLIREEHMKTCHAGVQILLNILRENFWILRGRKIVRSVVKGCVVCKRQSTKRFETIESALPKERVRDASVFEVTGVDLAGPLYLRDGRKAWVCLFTCAVYRAVHLELLTSLSTDAILQGFRRFVARRGRPAVVFSDNGLNFVGAENAFSALDWVKIENYSAARRINWKFIPPASPWWGGWWERMVGVLKQLLRRVLGKAKLQYEELLTILCDCEAVINSRPITYQSDSSDELKPLTPAMFIQDVKETGVPDCDTIDTTSLNKRLNYRMQILNDLRKRFRVEYLGELRQWRKLSKPPSTDIGDIVLVEVEDGKRLDWPIAKVQELILGKDGVVRLVRLKMASGGSLLRPIQRLYPLEKSCARDIEEDVSEEEQREEETVISAEEDIDPVKKTRSGREVKIPSRFLD